MMLRLAVSLVMPMVRVLPAMLRVMPMAWVLQVMLWLVVPLVMKWTLIVWGCCR